MKIFLDFDSTLVDLHEPYINWLKAEKNIKIKTKDISHWNWVIEQYGEDTSNYFKIDGIYEKEVKPISGSQLFIKTLNKLYGKENVFIISNSFKNMVIEKTEYARKNYDIFINNFIHVEDKWKFTSDGILVDDAPHNVVNHTINNRKPSILFNYRNRYGWAKLKNPISMITTCIGYSDCLNIIEKSKKFFPE